ncbi:DUF559 domain-containing protein [Diaminobutyricibacter sp. McL0608]|uniref:DUF559 domain-containing protein n=1 Tax=Leifsonia sp. McL0608 TaxID=3143537 RepID=UPI0031F30835
MGTLIRVRRGHYVTTNADPAQRAAVAIGGRLACASAASTYGLWSEMHAGLHVAVPPSASRLQMDVVDHIAVPSSAFRFGADAFGDVRIHWQGNLAPSECWRVSLADCLRGVVRCSPAESAIATLDTAIGLRLVDPAMIGRMFAAEPTRSRLIASRAFPGSESGVESLARQRLQRRGLVVRQQVAVRGVGRVDMLVDDRVFVEIDGFEFHSSQHHFARDRRRDAAFVLGGYRRLRFTAVDVLRDWALVEQTIIDVLRHT